MNAPRLARTVATAVAVTMIAGSAFAFDPQSTAPVNINPDGYMLQGFDPVAYFSVGEPTEGDSAFTAEFGGATYRFASADSRDAFVADPEQFIPAYGGFCALAMSYGQKVDIDPAAWRIVDDRLYVQANPRAKEVWDRDVPGNIEKADINWPNVKDKAPADL
ncbi:YHS domain-containing (seleno)protein [Bauldia sp.]|uniref:YHS domain-containing (seleno)protein n=1 Tax=Bauldia sp. TaxID=2575872 RepID=UPI003BAAC451